MSESHADEMRRLRNTMRDLVALSTLPAVWAGYAPRTIVGSLADVLAEALSAEIVFVRAGDAEAVRGAGLTADHIPLVAGVLAPWLTSAEPPITLPHPLNGADLHVAVSRFGHTGSEGAVVVCSRRPDFPGEADRLLMGVGANQAATVLQRKRAELALLAERERLRTTLSGIGDAVISTDAVGRVVFMNPIAEALTGWVQTDAAGRPLPEVFRIVNETSRLPVENPALRALREGVIVGLANHTILVSRDGAEWQIDDSAAPIRSGETVTGSVLVFRDITDRRKAEAAQARLAAIVESSDDAIVSKTLDGTIRSWNAGAERLFGYAAVEAVGRPITLVIPPERLGEERDILDRLSRGERVEHFETVRVRKDGRLVDVALTISPIRDAEGHVIGASKVARDVTASRRAARAQESALQAGEVGTYHWDVAADRVTGDRNFVAIFGVLADDSASAPVGDFLAAIQPDDRGRVVDEIRRTLETDAPFRSEYRVVGPVGERWVLARGAVERGQSGEAVGWDGVLIDITDRKIAEGRLAESEEKFRTLFETMDEGFCIIEVEFDGGGRAVDYRHVEANPAFEKHTGLRGALGRSVRRDFPDLEEFWFETYGRVAHTGEQARFEHRAGPLDGRWFDVCAFRLGGPASRRVAVLFDDVTERKRAEDELRRLASDLSESDRKKDDFIALLAHELRNPLAPIRNGLQVFRLAEDRAARDRAREMMDRQLAHMVRLIDDLLDVSRINRSKMELRLERLSIADVVRNAVETARPMIEEAEHELTLTLPHGAVYVEGDLTRLAQVVSNLLTNSAKYTPKGGNIWLTSERRGTDALISVRDNGIGIPTGALSDIFNMFSQVDRSVERETGGLGIGLALVKGLVEMHGGSVAAASEGEGRGSTFTVTLPVSAGCGESPVSISGIAPRRAARRVLVVDDNQDGAESLAMMLELLGDEVAIASDGIEAVAEAERFRPDVILMDVGMPRLNGLEATRQIRERPWGQLLVIIALTGWGQDNDRQRSRDAGCDGHLVKPVNLPDLETVLQETAAKRG